MKNLIIFCLSLVSFTAFAAPVSSSARLDVLKTLAEARDVKLLDHTNNKPVTYTNYKEVVVENLDRALGGKSDKNADYSIARLECDEVNNSTKCQVMIEISTYSENPDVEGGMEKSESGIIIDVELVKLGNGKLAIKNNQVILAVAG